MNIVVGEVELGSHNLKSYFLIDLQWYCQTYQRKLEKCIYEYIHIYILRGNLERSFY